METVEKDIMSRVDRLNAVTQWPKRFEALRLEKGMHRNFFCHKYAINESALSRYMQKKVLPRQRTLETIESALSAEGV